MVDTAGRGTPAGKARIELGAGVHAGQAAAKVVTLPLPALRRRAQARLSLTVRVARHPPPVVEAAVTATSPDDYDPADDHSVVRIATRPRALGAQATTATAAGAVVNTLVAFCPLTR